VVVIAEDEFMYLDIGKIENILKELSSFFNKGQIIFSVHNAEMDRIINKGQDIYDYESAKKDKLNIIGNYFQKKKELSLENSIFYKIKNPLDIRIFLKLYYGTKLPSWRLYCYEWATN
jgi:hypothetical protein